MSKARRKTGSKKKAQAKTPAAKLIILDRDGVINRESGEFVKNAKEWQALPGSLEAIARFNRAGILVAIASNQSGIARGLLDLDDLDAIHSKLDAELADVGGHIDAFFFCPHHPDDRCSCRKPAPGLLVDISRRLGLPLKDVPVVGDTLRDLEAAIAVDARPILVRTGNGKKTEKELDKLPKLEIYDDLSAAADALLVLWGQ